MSHPVVVLGQTKRRFSADALLSLLLFSAIAGHVAGFWQLPRWDDLSPSPRSGPPAASFDPHTITVAYSRPRTDGLSPWVPEDTERIMARFAQRWSEATLGRSRIVIMDETDLRNILIVFNNKTAIPKSEARSIVFAGGRLRYIEVFANATQPRVDVEYTADTLLHELAHALGCCTGPGTSGGHFVGRNCTRILCSPHGDARTFSADELRQLGLAG